MSPEEIYQFERNVESAIAGDLRSRGAAEVYERMQTEEFPAVKPRVIIESGVFVQASGQMAFSRQGVPFFSHYRGTVAIEVNTPRAGGAAYHHAMVGLLRRLFSGAGGGLRISPYDVLEAVEAPGNTICEKEGERDVSRLAFALQIAIPDRLLDTSVKDPLPAAPSAPV